MSHSAKRIVEHKMIVGYEYRGRVISVDNRCHDAYKYSYNVISESGKSFSCRVMTLKEAKRRIDDNIENLG